VFSVHMALELDCVAEFKTIEDRVYARVGQLKLYQYQLASLHFATNIERRVEHEQVVEMGLDEMQWQNVVLCVCVSSTQT
jgi:hypothetical protein